MVRAPVLGTGRYDYPGPGRPVEFVRVQLYHFVGALKRYEAKLERNSDRLRDAKFRPELGDIILYNPTASLEQGFYIRAGQPVERGVVVTIPVRTCIAPADSAQFRRLTRMPQQVFSFRGPDVAFGCCRS